MNIGRMILTAGLLATLSALSACSLFSRTELDRVDEGYDATTVTGQLDFYPSLPGRSAITNDEALRGVILFADGVDPRESYEQRVGYLQERGWLPAWFEEPANRLVQRGRLASVLSKAAEIDGGVMYNVTAGAPRYANRELVYLGIMDGGTEQQVVSGLQFLSILGRMEDYLIAQAVRELAEAQTVPEPEAVPGDEFENSDEVQMNRDAGEADAGGAGQG